jgi:hypothetical protein
MSTISYLFDLIRNREPKNVPRSEKDQFRSRRQFLTVGSGALVGASFLVGTDTLENAGDFLAGREKVRVQLTSNEGTIFQDVATFKVTRPDNHDYKKLDNVTHTVAAVAGHEIDEDADIKTIAEIQNEIRQSAKAVAHYMTFSNEAEPTEDDLQKLDRMLNAIAIRNHSELNAGANGQRTKTLENANAGLGEAGQHLRKIERYLQVIHYMRNTPGLPKPSLWDTRHGYSVLIRK